MPEQIQSRTRWLLQCAVLVFTLGFLARSFILFTSRYYNVAAEANALYAILEFAGGGALYPPRGTTPYYVNLYPPVHALLSKGMLWLVGTEALHSHVLTVRALSLVGMLAALVFMARCLTGVFGFSGLVSALGLAVVGTKFADYTGVARNDTLAIALDAACVYCLTRHMRKPGTLFPLLVAFFLAVLSAWTRQTGVLVFAAFLLVLATERKFKLALALGVVFSLTNILLFATLNAIYPAFVEHVVLSNLRSWRPVDRQFFDLSLFSFIASYALVVVFAILGLRGGWNEAPQRQPRRLFAFCALLTGLHAAVLFLRAGGDVNYFLPAVFFSLPFVCQGISRALLASKTAIPVTMLLVIHLHGTAGICAVKARSAFRTSQIPFEEAALRLRTIPGMGVLDGFYSQGMGVLVRGWAYQGPDVTNGGKVASNSHAFHSERWDELRHAAREGGLKTFAFASPGCGPIPPAVTNLGLELGNGEVLYPWLCVYPIRQGLRVSVASEQ